MRCKFPGFQVSGFPETRKPGNPETCISCGDDLWNVNYDKKTDATID